MKVQMISSVWCDGKSYSYNEILTSPNVDDKILKMFVKANLAKPLDAILEDTILEEPQVTPEINSEEVNENKDEEVVEKPKAKRAPRKRVI